MLSFLSMSRKQRLISIRSSATQRLNAKCYCLPVLNAGYQSTGTTKPLGPETPKRLCCQFQHVNATCHRYRLERSVLIFNHMHMHYQLLTNAALTIFTVHLLCQEQIDRNVMHVRRVTSSC